MAKTTSQWQRERSLILSGLLLLSALAWAVLIWQSRMMMSDQASSLTMGMSAFLFITIWIIMMIAMMFPASAPMILTFTTISANKRQQARPVVPTWVFVSAYLLVWSACGVLAYPLALGLEQWTAQSMWLMQNSPRFAGAVVVLAGLYQLSPWKDRCLAKCRTPLHFILTAWRDGYGGAFRMGMEHGIYCLGCCWLLFVLLFALGIMNLAVMALATALIFVEKTLPAGRLISKLAGGALIGYGVLVLFLPALLPMGMP